MAQIKTRVEGIAENILALSEQTQQIGEIIETVNEIADHEPEGAADHTDRQVTDQGSFGAHREPLHPSEVSS